MQNNANAGKKMTLIMEIIECITKPATLLLTGMVPGQAGDPAAPDIYNAPTTNAN
jgi:hypothetical protein